MCFIVLYLCCLCNNLIRIISAVDMVFNHVLIYGECIMHMMAHACEGYMQPVNWLMKSC